MLVRWKLAVCSCKCWPANLQHYGLLFQAYSLRVKFTFDKCVLKVRVLLGLIVSAASVAEW